ncbi:class I SAM-dependent DNA methyltransferase [Deinococcus soli (ex Cha et al. 2016)]|uniref:Type II restriction/modification system DNA methylase subunit YeeA n=1 Tax=Deinococcus soli (ex Cha et al. 2016) TaxID=1309411 RepID=A0ACC6KPP7_9DEIO|nr:class I SAM-dependent DNA methyltransferase [Deinococcus soli (ex Cha et al. 2016)]MDR6330604.1 type II restriction/modification system DNA methylase subunit YeeA [Deinococcus soli (ex Cha et al. 2016)]MDR6754381.1 type II restriction/modification system DNA methylase subunit YeeA [Deinococcus soli (ex Cha et al. 2016)]
MHPSEFAAKWRTRAPLVTEEQAYQEHYIDVASLVGGPVPGQAGAPSGLTYQAGVSKVGSTDFGKADVYLPGHFIWEAKRAQKTADARAKKLGEALAQATLYAYELGSPPLIVVTDFVEIRVHTVFNGTMPRMFRITLDDIEHNRVLEGSGLRALDVLRHVFHSPAELDPRLTRERMTTEATGQVGAVARAMVDHGHDRTAVAHFMLRVVFAMFAEDIGLLEGRLLTAVLERSVTKPAQSEAYLTELFAAMAKGGEFWGQDVKCFNGGLFDARPALPLTSADAGALLKAAKLDWSQVEPAIFGGLFESSLETEVRGKRGAHFTGVQDIERVVEPVVMMDLLRQWDAVRTQARELVGNAEAQALQQEQDGSPRKAANTREKARLAAAQLVTGFQTHLGQVTVLDPACGSGNFLYVALKRLMDLEELVIAEASLYGVGRFDRPPVVHPKQMLGIEIEEFAAELASVTLWIGFIQWNQAHGGYYKIPVLQTLSNIENRNALLTDEGEEASWPAAMYITGNPPFLGDKVMRERLGAETTEAIRLKYGDRLPGQSDLVCYWPEKARAMVEAGVTRRAGFVTTNSIRGGKNRVVLERIKASGDLFMAWPDEPWLQDGAAVRVSLFAFDNGSEQVKTLAGQTVADINPDLTSHVDVKRAAKLPENDGLGVVGTQKGGPFDISQETAQIWLSMPNPDGVSNADVIKPWVNGMDLLRRPSHRWIIDFASMDESEAEKYVAPFEYVKENVYPERQKNNRASYRERWWQHQEARISLRQAMIEKARVIAIPRVAKHLMPCWIPTSYLPDVQIVVVARDDDFTFGVLASTVHRAWARAQGTYMGVGNDLRYTPSTCFETFPFPDPTPEHRADIEKWARFVVKMREHLLTQDAKATLTGLYNDVVRLRVERDATHPVTALVKAHADLDKAVAAAYGWDWPLSEDDVLARLLALNLERAGT